MNSAGITRCPQCKTSFRVTDEQLRMADGAVRCGSCLTIFQAEAYIKDVPPHEPPVEITPEVPSDVAPEESMETADAILDEVVYLGYNEPLVQEIQEAQEVQEVQEVQDQEGASIAAYWEAFELYAVLLVASAADPEQNWQAPPVLVDPDLLVGEYASSAGLSFYWIAGAIVLMVFGVLQYCYFNFDSYATDMRYRQYALDACQYLGCDVPEYSDGEFLDTGDLSIRTHPSVSGALIVDAIVQNTGIFRQRFPDITLRFVNPKGTFVAVRTFSPGEYLAGEFRGLGYIPANTEVRFSLEIVDPGEMAVGYDLSLVVR